MKRYWYVSLVVIFCGLLFAGSASAIPTFTMSVTGGQVYTGSDAVTNLNSVLPIRYAVPEDFNYSGSSTFDIAGWWEFDVTSSTKNTPGSNWNEVFQGGTWYFQTTWNGSVNVPGAGSVSMPPAVFNQDTTWAEMYGKWFENNPNCYTYFKLYVNPSSGSASNGSTSPVGVFAFVADSGSANFGDISGLMQQTSWTVTGGRGTATASVPEPLTLTLLGLGLFGLVGAGRRFQK
jgi:hypothetical protein